MRYMDSSRTPEASPTTGAFTTSRSTPNLLRASRSPNTKKQPLIAKHNFDFNMAEAEAYESLEQDTRSSPSSKNSKKTKAAPAKPGFCFNMGEAEAYDSFNQDAAEVTRRPSISKGL